jgi:hypothetical protein
MSRTKKLILILTLLVASSVASACSDAGGPSQPNNSVQPNCVPEGVGSGTHC